MKVVKLNRRHTAFNYGFTYAVRLSHGAIELEQLKLYCVRDMVLLDLVNGLTIQANGAVPLGTKVLSSNTLHTGSTFAIKLI